MSTKHNREIGLFLEVEKSSNYFCRRITKFRTFPNNIWKTGHLFGPDSFLLLCLCVVVSLPSFFLWPAAAGKQPANLLSPTSSAGSSSHHATLWLTPLGRAKRQNYTESNHGKEQMRLRCIRREEGAEPEMDYPWPQRESQNYTEIKVFRIKWPPGKGKEKKKWDSLPGLCLAPTLWQELN